MKLDAKFIDLRNDVFVKLYVAGCCLELLIAIDQLFMKMC